MLEEEKKTIEFLQKEYKKLIEEGNILFPLYKNQANTILNLIDKLQKENEKKDKQIEKDRELKQRLCKEVNQVYNEAEQKDKIINNAIVEIENIRQYFSEDLQPEFIGVLEILKDKKVIDW